MILTDTSKQKVSDDIQLRQAIGRKLKVTDAWVKVLAQQNKPNGPLTTVGAVQVIREETQLADHEILIDEEALEAIKK
jgi:hypothetical protein